MEIYRSFSSAETKRFGYNRAKQFSIYGSQFSKRSGAVVFALTGELGSGKTTFVQGFLRGLGIKKRSVSPTFIIMRRSPVVNRKLKIENLYHIDAYRIKKARELAALEFNKILADPRNIVLIEWAENIKKILPKKTVWLRFYHGKKMHERDIKMGLPKNAHYLSK